MACKTLVYSRVTGFYSSTDAFNKGKKAEFRDRKTYTIEDYKKLDKLYEDQKGTDRPLARRLHT